MDVSAAAVDRVIRQLIAFESPGVFNPWSDHCERDAFADAARRRRKRLRAHMLADDVRIILCGEAPGHLGCRASGIPFSSERLLMEGAIPRVPQERRRITIARNRLSEPSATVVWGALHDCGLQNHAILCNAFAWHPMGEGPHTNRKPTEKERRAGLPVLDKLLALYPGAIVLAVGKTAARSLSEVGREPAAALRHPAFGGATEFRRGLRRAVRTLLN